MDAITPLIIAKALDGLSARAQATAANIANASSRDYRPLRVSFEAELRAATEQGSQALARHRPVMAASGPAMAQEMRVDLELATASQTSMRYAALLDVLGRQMAILRAGVAGGR